MLDIARTGQGDYIAGGERRISGLYQAVTSARSVTFVLQTMRNDVEGFDQWYDAIRAELGADPTCKWFVEVRNRIEKEGSPGQTSSSVCINHLDTSRLQPPPGAVSMFIGDSLGRSGWVIRLPDGTEQTVYFTLPSHVVSTHYLIADAPYKRDVGELLDYYLERLQSVVDRARDFLADKVWA